MVRDEVTIHAVDAQPLSALDTCCLKCQVGYIRSEDAGPT